MNYKLNHPLFKVLKTVNKNSCPGIINLHTHTTFSDGSLQPIELIKQAMDLGVKHIAVTDHHSVKAHDIINNWLSTNNKSKNINLWSGIEISCLLKGCLVHVLGLGFNTKSNFISKYTSGLSVKGNDLKAENVVNSIHNANGFCILAHPLRYKLNYVQLIEEAKRLNFDGIEVWYNYERTKIWKPTTFACDQIFNLVSDLDMLITCGTDTHGKSLMRR